MQNGSDKRALDDSGEATTEKRCAFCGVAGTVLSYRLMAGAVSSPMEQRAWYPTMPVREAKVSCGSCKCTSYGLLVFGHLNEHGRPSGHFVVLPLEKTVLW